MLAPQSSPQEVVNRPPAPQVEHERGEVFALAVRRVGQDEYGVSLLDGAAGANAGEGGEIASSFRWELATRVGEMNELDRAREAMRSGRADEETLARIAALGRRLYGFLLGGRVGEIFDQRRRSAERLYVQLYLPEELDDVPWEYFCEPAGPGDPRFLLLDGRLSLSRGNDPAAHAAALPELERPLRLLVVVSSPPDLLEDQKLDTLRELRLIREAVEPLVAAGELELREVDEPSPGIIADAMSWQPQIVHFTGHGNYDRELGGILLIEDGDNKSLRAKAQQVTTLFARPGVRLIVLSACRSGEASAAVGRGALRGIGAELVAAGTPAVVAMQDSIRDDHASIWAGGFYRGLVRGWSVAQAMSDARQQLSTRQAGDWGLPVLLSERPAAALFRFRPGSPAAKIQQRGVDNLLLNNPGGLFVGRQLEQRRLVRGLLGDRMRIGVIVGPGGIGKSSLAYRLYERTRDSFWAALSVDCSTNPPADQVLVLIDEWLRQNGDTSLAAVMANERLSPEQKLPYVVRALEQAGRRYLLIFDNFETLLDEQADGSFAPADPLTAKLLAAFARGLVRSKLLITCRLRFKFEHLAANVEWVALDDLSLTEATSLMGQHPRLGEQGDSSDYGDLWQAGVRNPRLIEYVEALLQDVDLSYVKANLPSVQSQLLENQLLDQLYARLPEDARAMLRRSSVYRLAVPLQFLELQVTDHPAARQPDRLRALLDRSLINRVDLDGGGGKETRYRLHESTRQWAAQNLTDEEGESGIRDAQRRGANAHRSWLANSHALEDALEAWRLFFAAGAGEEAGDSAAAMTEVLLRWGYYDLARSVLSQTLEALAEPNGGRAAILHNLGVLERDQGNYPEARRLYNESIEIVRKLGVLSGVAIGLHNLGILEQDQGNYPEARRLYNESIEIKRKLGNLSGVASSLHQLGILEQRQGNYPEARRLYNESLETLRKLGDLSGVANSLGQLGILEQDQGNYPEARRLYNESIEALHKLGDLSGVAIGLHQLGSLEQRQGNYPEARRLYNESLDIVRKLGNLSGVANSLGQLGILEQDQGNYPEARRLYNESIETLRKLSDLSGVAIGLHQLGILEQRQGNYPEARRLYNESLEIKRKLGNLSGVAGSLSQLGTLSLQEGDLEQAQALQEESLAICRRIADTYGVAISVGSLGVIAEEQGDYAPAVRCTVVALAIFVRLGSPNAEVALGALARTHEKVGDEMYARYWREAVGWEDKA